VSGKAATEPKATVHYLSSVKGITGESGNGLIYKGIVFRIPADSVGSAKQIDFEEMYDPLLIFKPHDGSEPAFDLPIERYEIWDIETGEMVVMYRMPYREIKRDDDLTVN